MDFTYENEARQNAIVEALSPFLKPGEFIISCRPFRWFRHDREMPEVISNAREGMDAKYICEERRWTLVHDFNYVAVVRSDAGEERHDR